MVPATFPRIKIVKQDVLRKIKRLNKISSQ